MNATATETFPAFSKVVRPGTVNIGRRFAPLFLEISWSGQKLSITGVEGPNRFGNALGSCGQTGIDASIRPAKGWTRGMIAAVRAAWDSHHLNDMKAGTPEQDAEIARVMAERKMDRHPGYETACAWLKAAGLYTVAHPIIEGETYDYGTAWLKREVPAEVLKMLDTLPTTDIPYPWTPMRR